MTTIRTERLDLVPLSPPLVAALVAGDLAAASALAPFALDASTFAEDAYVLGLRAAQLSADPTEEPWLYRAAVLRETGEVVGRIGFHSRPDEAGDVEVGYSTAPAWRRRGIAGEALRGLLAWGAAHGARRCLASIRPDNVASQRTIAPLGFVKIGEEVDEVDGLEEVYALELT